MWYISYVIIQYLFEQHLFCVIQVALAQSCSNASPGLQERAAGALWGLSVSEANRYCACSFIWACGCMCALFV